MIQSMTAFARSEAKGEWGALAWELRTVNHRYLDLSIRLPEEFRSLEPAVRERLSARVSRGKLDAQLRFQAVQSSSVSALKINRELAQALVESAQAAAGLLDNSAPISPMEILRWPGVIAEQERDLEPLRALALEQLDQAIEQLVETRRREGDRLKGFLTDRHAAVVELAKTARRQRPEAVARIQERLRSRLAELPVEADPARLEQELVIIATKMDVDEELDRLDAHLAELRQVLERKEPIGRRLDFLMQELNREANTLSSKSAHSETTQTAVELKVLIEQMREQVQNIE